MTIFSKTPIFLFIFVTLLLNNVPFCISAALASFSYQCNSLVAVDSTTEGLPGVDSSVHSLTGIYRASDETNIRSSQNSTYDAVQDSVVLHFWYDGAADGRGSFKVQGSLEFPQHAPIHMAGSSYGSQESIDFRSKSVLCGQMLPSFKLNGIWSEASGEICMVGSGSCYSENGNVLELPSLLKLRNLKNSSSITSLISGTLESSGSSKNRPNYFGLISMSMLPSMNYKYTFASTMPLSSCCHGDAAPPLSLKIEEGFCSWISDLLLFRVFELKYASHCVSAKNCSPISVSDLPPYMSLWHMECLEDEKKLRVLVDFVSSSMWDQWILNPSTTLVAEGAWDAERNQLCFAACRFLDVKNSLSNANVGDCSTRLSFWIPAVWTITSESSIQGEVWSNKAASDPDYFPKITFGSKKNGVIAYPLQGQEYEYTKLRKAAQLCRRKKNANDNSNNTFPRPSSIDTKFGSSVKNYKGEEVAWATFTPFSVGNKFSIGLSDSLGTEEYNLYNISYKISIKARGEVPLRDNAFYIFDSYGEMKISAEGVYDDREGSACMIGCRDIQTKQSTDDSLKCDIIAKIEFPPTIPKSSFLRYINATIKSTRKKSDLLYFEAVEFTSAAYYNYEAVRSIWRMDVQVILVLLSNILSCVFGISQLFHVKRHPNVLPSISVCMLCILGLGSIIPLLLNFNAIFTPYTSQTLLLGSKGWSESTDIVVNAIVMVDFVVQIRLLQLTMSARSANGNQKDLWAVEKLALFVALPAFVAGALLALLLMNWRTMYYIEEMIIVSGHGVIDIICTVLKTCGGLVLDAFLLPQILLNIFRKTSGDSLAASFYIGTTFVRMLPHAYYVYIDHNWVATRIDGSSYYAGPAEYMYPIAWNVIIPSVGLFLAGIIHLQQQFGGRCIIPQKLERLVHMIKVSI